MSNHPAMIAVVSHVMRSCLRAVPSTAAAVGFARTPRWRGSQAECSQVAHELNFADTARSVAQICKLLRRATTRECSTGTRTALGGGPAPGHRREPAGSSGEPSAAPTT